MDVVAWSPNLTPERAAEGNATLVTKDELFQRSDVISVHMVLSDRSRGLIGEREFGLMKPTRPPHSPTPVPILTVSGAADAKANSLQSLADSSPRPRGTIGRAETPSFTVRVWLRRAVLL